MSETELIRVIVVDDEAPARAILSEMLASHPQFEIVAECSNGYEAVKAAGELRPDLLFLDIQMPKLDGFEVLDLLEPKPKVVFVTAYDEYAIRAFEVHAVDYLLKPYSAERFASVVEHAAAAVRSAASSPGPARASAEARRPLQRIALREEGAIEVIPVSRIDYIEARDDYVQIVERGRKHLKQQTLGELEQLLDSSRFVRIHRSYLVNVESLSRVEPYAKDSRIALLKDGSRIPVSRAGYERLKTLL